MKYIEVTILFITFAMFSYGYVNIHRIRRTYYQIFTHKKLPATFRIAMIGDLHYKNAISALRLKQCVDNISTENPDIAVLVGDIVDEHTGKNEMIECFNILSQIKTTYGIYYVYGNHDRKSLSFVEKFTTEDLADTITSTGIKILQDETIQLTENIVLIGREDLKIKTRAPLEKLLTNMNAKDFSVVLDHEPQSYKEAFQHKIDLQLSGHTHHGQVFPVGLLSRAINFFGCLYGHLIQDNSQLVVTSGLTGWGIPLRTEGISEYVILDVVEEKEAV